MKNSRHQLRLALAVLLAAWLGFAQTAVAAHDAIHHLHAHVDLCDLLAGHGNGPALTANAVTPALSPATSHPACPQIANPVPSHSYPAFHSRAPPR